MNNQIKNQLIDMQVKVMTWKNRQADKVKQILNNNRGVGIIEIALIIIVIVALAFAFKKQIFDLLGNLFKDVKPEGLGD